MKVYNAVKFIFGKSYARIIGSGGMVAVDRRKTSAWFSKNNGSSKYHSGNIIQHSNGSWTDHSASAQGNVVGYTIGGTAYPRMGKNHSVTITSTK